MRTLFDTDNTKETINIPGQVTPEQLSEVYAQIADLNEQIDQTNKALADYKKSLQEGLTTGTIVAEDISVKTIDIEEPLDISALDTSNLTVANLAQIHELVADTARLTQATMDALTATDMTATDLTAITVTTDEIKAKTAQIEEWAIDNLSIDNLEVDTFTATEANIEQLTATDVVAETLKSDTIETPELTVEEASIEEALVKKMHTIGIDWSEYETITDGDDFVIAIPYFENGTYFVRLCDEATTYVSAEISNSIGASYTVSWGQKELGWITKFYIDEDDKLYIQAHNKLGIALKLYYASVAGSQPDVVGSYDKLPVFPETTYDITTEHGTKFYTNVVTPTSDPQSLHVTTTHDYDRATDDYTYDIAEPVTAQVYKPDQSLNKDDSVEFQEVKAPILGVATLEVSSSFDGPHIKDCPADFSTAVDGEYLSFNVSKTTGTVPTNYKALVTYKKDTPSTFMRGPSADLADIVANDTIVNDGGQYSTAQGVALDGTTLKDIATWQLADQDATQSCIVSDEDGVYWNLIISSTGTPSLNKDGTPVDYTIVGMYNSDDELIQLEIPLAPTAIGSNVYMKDTTGTYHKYTVQIPNAMEASQVVVIPYTQVDPAGSALKRVTVDNGTVSTADIPAVATNLTKKQQPLQYNDQTKQLEYTDNLELDTLQVEGNTTINGDLYVKGTTHTTDTEDIVSAADTLVLRANNDMALGSGQVAGVIVNKYDGSQDLNLVTDNEGTLRVGTGSGTDTTYNNVLFDSATNKWYSYTVTAGNIVLGSVVNINGTVTSWTNRRVENTYTVYDSVTATVIDKTSLVPLLGRAENANMTDKGLLSYDKTNLKAVTVSNADVGKDVFNAIQPGTGDIADTDNAILQTGTANPVKRTMSTIVDYIKTKLNLKQLFDKLSTSTADVADTDTLISQTGTSDPVKKPFSKVWSYILGKIKGLTSSSTDVADTDTLISQTGTSDPVKKQMSVFWSWVAKKIQQNGFTNATNSNSPWFNMTNNTSSGDVIPAQATLSNTSKVALQIGTGHANKGIWVQDSTGQSYWLIRSDDTGRACIDSPTGVYLAGGIREHSGTKQIFPEYSGAGLTATNISNLAGFKVDGNNVTLRDISKDEVKKLLNSSGIKYTMTGAALTSSNPISNTNPPRLAAGEMTIHTVYNAGGPCTYGNLINIGGMGGSQILYEWSGNQTTSGQAVAERVFYRSMRDNQSTWTAWTPLNGLNIPDVRGTAKSNTALVWIGTTTDIDSLGIGTSRYVDLLKAMRTQYGAGLLLVQTDNEMSGLYLTGDSMCIFNPGDRNTLNFYDTDTTWNNSNIGNPTWSIDGSIASGAVRLPVGQPSNPQVGDMWLT